MSKNNKKGRVRLQESDSGQSKNSRFQETGKLTFSFEYTLECKKYGLISGKDHTQHNKRGEINTDILEMLKRISKQHWDDLHKKRKNEGGLETLDVDRVNFKNKKELKETIRMLETGSKVYVIRFSSQKMRCVGLRKNDTFYIICFDYDLTLYSHGS